MLNSSDRASINVRGSRRMPFEMRLFMSVLSYVRVSSEYTEAMIVLKGSAAFVGDTNDEFKVA